MRAIRERLQMIHTPTYPYTPQEVTRHECLRPPTLTGLWDIALHIGFYRMPYHQWRWASTSWQGLLRLYMCLSTHLARPREWQVTFFAIQHLRSVLLQVNSGVEGRPEGVGLLPFLRQRWTDLLENQREPPQCDRCTRITNHQPVTKDIAQELCPSPGFQYLYKYKSVEQASLGVPRKTKFREVISYSMHPYPRVGKLMGRCLTQFW